MESNDVDRNNEVITFGYIFHKVCLWLLIIIIVGIGSYMLLSSKPIDSNFYISLFFCFGVLIAIHYFLMIGY